MADEVPQALKQADINLYKTATRGAQLQSVKPIIAYWCTSSSEPLLLSRTRAFYGQSWAEAGAGAGADQA